VLWLAWLLELEPLSGGCGRAVGWTDTPSRCRTRAETCARAGPGRCGAGRSGGVRLCCRSSTCSAGQLAADAGPAPLAGAAGAQPGRPDGLEAHAGATGATPRLLACRHAATAHCSASQTTAGMLHGILVGCGVRARLGGSAAGGEGDHPWLASAAPLVPRAHDGTLAPAWAAEPSRPARCVSAAAEPLVITASPACSAGAASVSRSTPVSPSAARLSSPAASEPAAPCGSASQGPPTASPPSSRSSAASRLAARSDSRSAWPPVGASRGARRSTEG
jgi:hypothetical protein